MNHNALDRRNFLKISLLGGAALTLPWGTATPLPAAEVAASSPPLPPNSPPPPISALQAS